MRLCYQISFVSSFVTNSSSVVHGYDRKALDHPQVKAFMKAYGVEEGYVGEDLFNRGTCESILVTPHQQYIASISSESYGGDYSYTIPVFQCPNTFFLVFGDEYDGLAQELNALLSEIERRENVTLLTYTADYN